MCPLRPLAIAASLLLALTAKPALAAPINMLPDSEAESITWAALLPACIELGRSRDLCNQDGKADRIRPHREGDLFLVSLFTGFSGAQLTVEAEPLLAAANVPLHGNVVVAPEPPSWWLLATGLALVVWPRPKRR